MLKCPEMPGKGGEENERGQRDWQILSMMGFLLSEAVRACPAGSNTVYSLIDPPFIIFHLK